MPCSTISHVVGLFLSFVVDDFNLNLEDALSPGKLAQKYLRHLMFAGMSWVNGIMCFGALSIDLMFSLHPDPEPKPEKPAAPPPKPGGGGFPAYYFF